MARGQSHKFLGREWGERQTLKPTKGPHYDGGDTIKSGHLADSKNSTSIM